MSRTFLIPTALATGLFLLVGCASTTAVRIESADQAPQAKQVSLARYDQILVDPPDLTMPDETHWKGVDEAVRAKTARLVQESFTKATAPVLGSTDKPGTGVLRLHLTVEDLRPASPVVSSISHVIPIGLALNVGRSASGAQAPKNMGSVTIAGQLRDAQSNALLATFETKQGPDPMNLSAAISKDTAMKAAIEKAASRFATALGKARTESQACAEEEEEQVCLKTLPTHKPQS